MKRIFLYLAWLLPGYAFAQDTSRLTLADCINIAMENNEEVQKGILRAESEHIGLQQARANLLPNLNASYSMGSNQGRSIDPFTNAYINQQYTFANFSASSSVALFNGFLLFNTIRRNALSYQAEKMQIQQIKDNLTLNVILSYLQVLTNEEQVTLAENQQRTTQKQLERLETLNKEGAIAPGEYYELKGTLANDQLNLVNALNALENSKLSLSRLMNIPYSKGKKLERLTADEFLMDYTASVEEVYITALDNLALVKVADLRKKSADMQVKVSRSGYYPSLFLNAGVYSNYSGAANIKYKDQINNNLNTSVSAGLNIPLFNAFRTRNNVKWSKLDQQSAGIDAKNTRIQLRQLTEEAYFNMNFSKDRYQTLIGQADFFHESFKRSEVRFTLGASTVVDYIISKNNYDKANSNLINARYDYLLRTKILDYYQGKLKL